MSWPAIERTWEEDSPSLYGRFDLSYDGEKCTPAKLLEYNADTPTALLEAAVIQWHWLEETYPGDDQWNSLHERLVAAWRRHAPRLPGNVIHFAATDEETSGEDLMTVTYLRDTAGEAGLQGVTLAIEEIGWDDDHGRFVGAGNEPLHTVFKLYPWEWMFEDRFGRMALQNLDQMRWIEPVWKSVLSGKGILPILWELFPGHPNLLPAYRHAPRDLRAYARKPIWGREGANVTLVTPEEMVERPVPYDRLGWIYQGACPLPSFDGQRPVLGSWIVDGEPAGLGIRESDGPITDNRSRFVPHRIPCASAAF